MIVDKAVKDKIATTVSVRHDCSAATEELAVGRSL